MRADTSVLGTLPSRGFQYCEALRAASSFGWYVFPPIDFTLQWDGSQIIWTYRGAKAWYPLTSAQFPGYRSVFDRAAPEHLRGFSPPFLTALPEPGIIQLWTGLMVESAKDWSILVRPPANLPRSLAFDLVRRDRRNRPLVRAAVHQPASHQDRRTDPFQHRDAARAGAAAASEHLRRGGVEPLLPSWTAWRDFPREAWQRYEEHDRQARMLEPAPRRRLRAPRCGAGAGAVAPCTLNERLLGRGGRGPHLGVLPGGDPRRRHRIVRAAGAGDAALRRRRPAFPALPAAALPHHPPQRLAARRAVDAVPGRRHGSAGDLGPATGPREPPGSAGPGRQSGLGRAARVPGVRAKAVGSASWSGRCCARCGVLLHRLVERCASETWRCWPATRCSSRPRRLARSTCCSCAAGAWARSRARPSSSLYSALVVVPWYLWSAPAPLWRVARARVALAGSLARRADRLRRFHRA